MHIPSYQIHNVIKVYSRRLCQSEYSERQNEFGTKSSVNRINMPSKGKRETIIEKVATDILERISRFGSLENGIQEIEGKNRMEDKARFKPRNQERGKFVFNTIDESNQKRPHTLSTEDSVFLIKRLEKLAGETIEKREALWSGGMI